MPGAFYADHLAGRPAAGPVWAGSAVDWASSLHGSGVTR
jgi:hypothetical protein